MTTDTTGAAEVEYPPAPWGVKAMILAGGPAVGLALGGVSVVLPKIQAELAHGAEDQFLVKMLAGSVGAAMLIGAPLTGFLSDRLGLRKVLFLTYLVFTIAGSAGLYLNNLPVFVAARFLLGVAGSGAVTASIIIINKRLAPSERPTWMGAYIAASYIATFLLHPLAGFLAELNWHYAFIVYLAGAPFILIALTSFDALPKNPVKVVETGEKEGSIFKWFPYRLAGLGLIMGFIVYLVVIYVPFQLALMGVGPGKASLYLLASSATGTVTSLLFGRMRRRLSDDAAFIFAFATTGVGGIVMGLATDQLMVAIGLAIAGLGVGWFMPNLMVVVGKSVNSNQQGRAAGLVKASNYVSMPLCIMVLEGLSQAYGPWLPVFMSGVLGLGLMLFYIVRVLSRRSGVEAQPITAS